MLSILAHEMDVEFLSGIVISYSKLLREVEKMKKDVKLILDNTTAILASSRRVCCGSVASRSLESNLQDGIGGFGRRCVGSGRNRSPITATLRNKQKRCSRDSLIDNPQERTSSDKSRFNSSFLQEIEDEISHAY